MSAQMLVEMGFSLESSEAALEISNGNLDAALNFLLSGDLPPQPQTSQASLPEPMNHDLFAQGCECIQSEISQFSFPDGRSACTAISCEAAICLMNPSRDSVSPELIRRIIEDGIGIFGRITQQSGVEHTAADEILPIIPRFISNLKRTSDPFVSIQGLLTNEQCFMSMFEQAKNTQGVDPTQPISLIVTKPPETVLVVMPPATNSDGSWYLFDSHSRPQLGLTGGYIITAPSARHVSVCLRVLFPAVDLADGGFMAEMYNSFEAVPMQLQSNEAAPGPSPSPSEAAPGPSPSLSEVVPGHSPSEAVPDPSQSQSIPQSVPMAETEAETMPTETGSGPEEVPSN